MRSVRLVAVVLAVAVFLGTVWWWSRPSQRAGHRLTAALQMPARDSDEIVARHKAVQDAIAALPNDSAALLSPLASALNDDDPTVQNLAVAGLGKAGPGAVPLLLPLLERPNTAIRTDAVLRAIGAIGPGARQAVPLLAQHAERGSLTALESLGRLVPASSQAVPTLAALVRGEGTATEVRETALHVLRFLGPHAEEAVPVLIDLLRQPRSLERTMLAAETLGHTAATSEEAVNVLRALLTRPDLVLRLRAAEALVRLRPADAPLAVPVLLEALKGSDHALVRRAALAFRPLGADAVPVLAPLLDSPDRKVRGRAAFALGQLGPAASSAIPAFEVAASEDELGLRFHAATALRRIRPPGAELSPLWWGGGAVLLFGTVLWLGRDYLRRTWPVLLLLLLACCAVLWYLESRRSRRAALDAALRPAEESANAARQRRTRETHTQEMSKVVETLGPWDRGCVDLLVNALHEPDAEVAAARGLGRIGSAAGAAVPALVARFEDAPEPVALAAVVALGDIGPAAREATRSLVRAMREATQVHLRVAVVESLGKIGTASPEVVPALAVALQDEATSAAAAQALVRLGRASVPALEVAVLAGNAPTRQRAVQALGEIGPRARPAVPLLRALEGQENPLGSAARTARRQIEAVPTGWRGLLVVHRWKWASALGVLAVWWGLRVVRRRRARDSEQQRERRRRVDECLRLGQAQLAWRFLHTYPDATRRQRAELLLLDQGRRWRSGYPWSVHDYVAHFPELADEGATLLALLVGEYRWSRQLGRPVGRGELLAQFPELRQELARRLDALADSQPAPTEAASPPSGDAATVDHVPAGTSLVAQSLLDPGATRSLATVSEAAPAYEGFVPPRHQPGLKQIGRYTVERVLGRGGFGTVYLAHDPELRRQVAVKLPRRPAGTGQELDLQAAEARTLAGLDHPAVVPVYDVGRTDDGRLYIVSKYIPGSDLASALDQRDFTPAEAATMTARAAQALGYAHRQGLIHRDIKPANLLLDVQGRVHVADFGLALTREAWQEEGQLAGTPAYMSPEQACGEVRGLDGRSDLFSLGVVLYELLTRQRPFPGQGLSVLDQIQELAPAAPHTVNPKVPLELSRICLRCLAKHPADRFASMDELANALDAWQKSIVGVRGLDPHLDPVTRCLEELAPFRAAEAVCYQGLLPGRRGPDDLPLELSWWKRRLEETEAARTFAVGLLTGVAGAGKSSFVQAGLLPCLSATVLPVLSAVVPGSAAADLLQALRCQVTNVPASLSLVESCRRLKQGTLTANASKVVLILDQAENLLAADSADLEAVLRECDGARLQAVLVVRQERRPSVVAMLGRIGLRVIPGENEAVLEPFEPAEAQRVLLRLGQSLRILPGDATELSSPQQRFLALAMTELIQEGRTRAVRLMQLARATRARAWTPGVLSQSSGASGCLTSVLAEQFRSRSGAASERRAETLARLILARLLPAEGEPVRSRLCSRGQLLELAQEEGSFRDVDAVLATLDSVLRLIVLADAEDETAEPGYRLSDELAAAAARRWVETRPSTPRPVALPGTATPEEERLLASLLSEDDRASGRSLVRPALGCVALLLGVLAVLVNVGLSGVEEATSGGFWEANAGPLLVGGGIALLFWVVASRIVRLLPERRERKQQDPPA